MLECFADANPATDDMITWQRDGYTLGGNKTKAFYSNGTSFLTVYGVQKEDIGEFLCVVDNGLGDVNATAGLLVERECDDGDVGCGRDTCTDGNSWSVFLIPLTTCLEMPKSKLFHDEKRSQSQQKMQHAVAELYTSSHCIIVLIPVFSSLQDQCCPSQRLWRSNQAATEPHP